MKNPSPEQLTELKRFAGNSRIREYLQSAYEAERDSLVAEPDSNLMRVKQGRAQALSELLKLLKV